MPENNRISQSGYWFTAVNIFLAGLLLIFVPETLGRFLKEDSVVENLGAVFLLLTGIVLAYAARQHQKGALEIDKSTWLKIIILALTGLAFIWAAGEEVSWGQRIFGFNTPESLVKVNTQKEANLHNLNTRFFNNGLETIILLAILVPTVLRMRGRDHLFGFVLPSFPIIMGFQLVACYVTYHYVKPQDYISYLMLPILLVYFYRKKEKGLAIKICLSTLLIIFIAIVNIKFKKLFPGNGPREFREYLFSFLCLIYAAEILMDIRRPKQN